MPVGKKKWAGSGFWGSGPNGGGKRAGGAGKLQAHRQKASAMEPAERIEGGGR